MHEQFVEPKALAERRNQQWDRIGRLHHRAYVLIPNRMKGMRTDHALVGSNSDDWSVGWHDDGERELSYPNALNTLQLSSGAPIMSLEPAVNSYYGATAHPAVRWPALAGSVDCDVCVVGGGIAGCSVALHLVERGFRVVLVEAQRVGWGASGRNGGQALSGVAAGQAAIEGLLDATDARAVWDVTIAGLTLIKERIVKHSIACDWAHGYMQVALKMRHERELHAELAMLRDRYGYESVRYMPRDEVRSLLATTRYTGALYDSASGHLHPLNYTLGLAAAAAERGVDVFENTRALSFAPARHIEVRTPNGQVRCRHLALCGNTYLGALAPALARKILPVATYIVATESLGAERARRLIANNAAVSDMNWVLDYFRLSADTRLLFGGRVSYSARAPSAAPAATRARMLQVFPQLADTRIEYNWGGLVDITLNRAPHFGRLAPNVYFLQGFSGHGVALAGIGGALLAQAIAGTAERFDVFARIPHRDFPGGTHLQRPALVLAMLYYRLRDLL
jgi:gamma-glutamylputrescine oxidase